MIGTASGSRPTRPMRAFFLDSENGAMRLLDGMELLTRSDLVVVFHRGGFPAEVKNKLELALCSVEWVKCVDPGVKNSMDVQIIAELSMRLAAGGFESAYILSEDKGYLPAVHYLQQKQQGRGCDIALAKSVVHASSRAVLSTLAALKSADSVEDVEQALALMHGEDEARAVVDGFKKIFAKPPDGVAGSRCGAVTVVREAPAEIVELPEEPSGGPTPESRSFIGLPGIGRALAGKLENAGMLGPAELARKGAVKAWISIYRMDASFPPKWVYSFEAAIEGVPVHAIDPETKRRLKGEVKAFLSGKENVA